jgi:hypothetical protein
MTRRTRNIILGGASAALIMAGAVSQAFAIEPGDFTNYLRGATQGLPLGAAPPPGVYFSISPNATGLGGQAGRGDATIPGAAAAPAFGTGFVALFVPGWTFLGGTYEAAVVQGLYFGTNEPNLNPPFAVSTNAMISPEIANTDFTPIALSWALGHGWFVAGSVHVVGPDGSQWASTAADTNLNPDYWTVAPAFAVSYLDANWVLSANFRYDIAFASPGVTSALPTFAPAAANGYVNGNELFGDLTALYKLGKWSFGPVGYFEVQTTQDTPGNGIACNPGICGYQSQVDVGALVGYDFGPVALQVWADYAVECQNCVGANGWDVWMRTSFRIWGPDTPKPLVAKN